MTTHSSSFAWGISWTEEPKQQGYAIPYLKSLGSGGFQNSEDFQIFDLDFFMQSSTYSLYYISSQWSRLLSPRIYLLGVFGHGKICFIYNCGLRQLWSQAQNLHFLLTFQSCDEKSREQVNNRQGIHCLLSRVSLKLNTMITSS